MKQRNGNGLIYGRKVSSARGALKLTWLLAVAAMVLAQARPARAIVHSSILINAQTGQVLQDYNPDARAHPASLTKLMTLYITFQRLAEGRMMLNQRLRVSAHAAAQQPSKLGLRAGTTVSVRTCILGIISHSANDAAVVLAENIAGSETRFARLMNAEARQLGMTRTIFYNASGLPNDRQWTTARDMATLALSIIQTYPQYYHYFDTHSLRYRGRMYYSFDHLPEEYRGADGMKTGFINSSGFNIVTSAVRDHHRLIGVIMGGQTARVRDLQMISLLNHGFAHVAKAETLLAKATVPRPEPPTTPRMERKRQVEPVHAGRPRLVKVALVRKAVEPVAPVRKDCVIQVGYVLRSSVQARHVLHSARLSSPTLLHHGRGLVVLLRDRHYLARFSDLSGAMGFQACTALRRKGYTCTILQGMREQQDMASAAHAERGLSE
jgi:D-alanyl-D-alanine carboxypeptidase